MNTLKILDTSEFRAMWDDNVPGPLIGKKLGYTGTAICASARRFGYPARNKSEVIKRGIKLRAAMAKGAAVVKPMRVPAGPAKWSVVANGVAHDELLATKGGYAALTAWALKQDVSFTVAMQRWHIARAAIRGGGVL